MSALKTKQNETDVQAYLNNLSDTQQQSDCRWLIETMEGITGHQAKMWGNQLIGFDSYDYKQSNGKDCSWFMTGFGPRKGNISIYIMTGFDHYPELMKNLGKYKTGVGCLYVKKLDDINRDRLKELIEGSYNLMKTKHGK
ncbi:MAG: DUF1801 domain-containing protein [Chitinophagaceae bacterium]|jgi:hypothetical protein|nr:DUF1801 domain-containing protein [Chitinophagaceae bacterium]MCU0403914.1 DUF1801 domain-containing protein [Chitinophagaceae bacterium]